MSISVLALLALTWEGVARALSAHNKVDYEMLYFIRFKG